MSRGTVVKTCITHTVAHSCDDPRKAVEMETEMEMNFEHLAGGGGREKGIRCKIKEKKERKN